MTQALQPGLSCVGPLALWSGSDWVPQALWPGLRCAGLLLGLNPHGLGGI